MFFLFRVCNRKGSKSLLLVDRNTYYCDSGISTRLLVAHVRAVFLASWINRSVGKSCTDPVGVLLSHILNCFIKFSQPLVWPLPLLYFEPLSVFKVINYKFLVLGIDSAVHRFGFHYGHRFTLSAIVLSTIKYIIPGKLYSKIEYVIFQYYIFNLRVEVK
jgi:hypothetical protein